MFEATDRHGYRDHGQGGYSYVQIEKDGVKKWVAVPRTCVKEGETIAFNPGMEEFYQQDAWQNL